MLGALTRQSVCYKSVESLAQQIRRCRIARTDADMKLTAQLLVHLPGVGSNIAKTYILDVKVLISKLCPLF